MIMTINYEQYEWKNDIEWQAWRKKKRKNIIMNNNIVIKNNGIYNEKWKIEKEDNGLIGGKMKMKII